MFDFFFLDITCRKDVHEQKILNSPFSFQTSSIWIQTMCIANQFTLFGWQVVLEESKQADVTTGQAAHRISKGIHDKVPESN